jgi:hypothetical protein
MSRYKIPADDPRYDVIVGFDDPLDTFFGQIFDTTVPEEDDNCVLWVGATLQALPTVDVLQDCLHAYATIPPEVMAQLRHDHATTRPRSPLQEEMLQMLSRSRDA